MGFNEPDCFESDHLLGTYVVTAPINHGPSSPACRLWLPSDALYALRCSPGTIKLVALAGSSERGGRPCPLVERFNTFLKINIRSSTQGPGDYFVPSELWPSPKLRPGTASLSHPLHWALGAPDTGASILVQDTIGSSYESSFMFSESICLQLQCAFSADHHSLPLQPRTVEDLKASPGTPVASPSQKAQGRRQNLNATSPTMRNSATQLSPAMRRSQAVKDAKTTEAEETTRTFNVEGYNTKAVYDALFGTGRLEGKLLGVMQYLAFQALRDRYILEGNLLRLPLLGLDVVVRVGDVGRATAAAAVRVRSCSAISFALWSEDGVDESIQRLQITGAGQSAYCQKAAQAAAEVLGGGEEGPAGRAALEAARSGDSSRGTSFDDLGGLKAQVDMLRRLVTMPLLHFSTFSAYNIAPPSGVLLHGPPGTGKSALARAAAGAAQANFFVINGPDVVAEHLGESELCLRGIFAAARSLAPSIIFIDEIDALAPSRGGNGQMTNSPVSARLVTTLLTELDSITGYPVVVLAATNRLEALDDSLRRPGRLDKELEIGVPSPRERYDIIRKMLKGMLHSLTDDEVANLADDAHGYVGADLGALCSEAAMSALRRTLSTTPRKIAPVTIKDFLLARSFVRPSALREVALQPTKVRWSDVGGNEEIKQQLKEVVEWPSKCRESLARIGAIPPRGVLLYGPPGCSKTLLAKAVAREANMNFLAVKGPELLNKYVGESEKALRNVFSKARAASPVVIFFDEIDGLIGARSDGSTHRGGVDVGDRVLSQLLQEMDGLQGGDRRLIVMAATNRPDCLDPALLRPGRFDRLLFVPPPDRSSRQAIFEIHTRKTPLHDTVDIEQLAALTEGYTGADIASICQQAAVFALEEDMNASYVTIEHFTSALSVVSPSTLAVSADADKIYRNFRRQVS